MKKKLIIAGAAVAGAILVTYLLKAKKRVRQIAEPASTKRSHHLTNVFSNAKSNTD